MASILIKNVVLNGKVTDVAIQGNRFAEIKPGITGAFDRVLNGAGKTILPPFYNCHTHAAMTLLRGYADDLELFDWLSHYIWPVEAQFSREDIYIGSKLACLEMIKTGTVFFNDMYYSQRETIRAAEEMGIRANIGLIHLDNGNPEFSRTLAEENAEIQKNVGRIYSSRISVSISPHAIYTVKEPELRAIAEQSEQEHLNVHIHLAETASECADCQKAHHCSPVEYLAKIGLLNKRSRLAHAVHLSDSDLALVAERGATLIHMASSNMKLASGMFRYHDAEKAGCKITIGTDGCASNNNHSMMEEIKFSALSGKIQAMDPTATRADHIFRAATIGGAEAFVPEAGGIAVGKLADAMLIDLNSVFMVGDYNLVSNLVYSADSSCVDSVICDGNILMEHRTIPHELEILDQARECCRKFKR